MIWFKPYTTADIQRFPGKMTLGAHLGIEFMELGSDYLKARMPVDERTHQPMGLLHGGASVALAETVASVAGTLCVDSSRFGILGQEINANHVRGIREGYVYGVARPLHIGQRSQVWDIRITDANQRLVCISRMTAAVIEIKVGA